LTETDTSTKPNQRTNSTMSSHAGNLMKRATLFIGQGST